MRKKFFIILWFWIFIVIVFVVFQNLILNTGTEILLKTVPVDPRDLLRGDYVILNYEIAQLPRANDYKKDETVYVVLEPDDKNVAHVLNISKHKPQHGLFLKGHVGRTIKFGIESYFVEEGTGKELEQNLRDGTLVRVVVDKNGAAKVKGFLDN